MWNSIVTWHPWPGMFIAILALLGVLVPLLREKIGKREKAVWTLVMFALLMLEIRSLKLAQDDFIKDRKDANDKFGEIAGGLKTAISDSHSQFDATIKKSDNLLNKTRSLTGLVTTDLNQVAVLTRSPILVFQILPTKQPGADGMVTIPFMVRNDVFFNSTSTGSGEIYVHICDRCSFGVNPGWLNLSGQDGKERLTHFDYIYIGLHTPPMSITIKPPPNDESYEINWFYTCQYCRRQSSLPPYWQKASFPPYLGTFIDEFLMLHLFSIH